MKGNRLLYFAAGTSLGTQSWTIMLILHMTAGDRDKDEILWYLFVGIFASVVGLICISAAFRDDKQEPAQ